MQKKTKNKQINVDTHDGVMSDIGVPKGAPFLPH